MHVYIGGVFVCVLYFCGYVQAWIGVCVYVCMCTRMGVCLHG